MPPEMHAIPTRLFEANRIAGYVFLLFLVRAPSDRGTILKEMQVAFPAVIA